MRFHYPSAWLVVAIATTWTASAHAETAEATKAMTLRDAIAYAHAHQPAIRLGRARVDARVEEARIADGRWKPLVGVTAQIYGATANNTTGTYVTPWFMDIPRIGATRATSSGTFSPYPSTFVGAGVTQEIFDFGRIAAERAAGDALVEAERRGSQAAGLDVDFDVEEAYFAVLAARSVVTVSEQAYERSRAHRDLAKAGVDGGMRPPIELTRAEAELARIDISRTRARGGLLVAQSGLASAIGASDAAVDAADDAPRATSVPTLADAMQRAAERDPRVLEALAQLKAQEARTRAIGAELRPDVSLTAGINGRAGGAPPSSGEAATGGGWIPTVPNWDVGLVFTWPIFDGTIGARQDASRAREEVRRQEIATLRLAQVAAIRRTYIAFDVARAALPGLARAVEAARANYAQADARFRGGLGTSVELADAELLRTDAEIQLAVGQFEVARARAAFGRAIAEGA